MGVIADDLTGAAEIRPIGLRHALRAEVILACEPGRADLVCVDTDSHFCEPTEAARRAATAAPMLQDRGAGRRCKKIDSVLRGDVTPEIEARVTRMGLSGALLVPAIPSPGRKLVNGHYDSVLRIEVS